MSGIVIPTLRTPRLTLRAFRESDLPSYAAMMGDPAVVRFLGTGQARTESETWAGMARALGQWAMRGYGLFALEHDGVFAGHAGVLHPPDWPEPELAYALAPSTQGRGLATEAAAAIRAWAAGQGLGPLISLVRPDNARSRAVLARLGAREERAMDLLGAPALIYRHSAAAEDLPETGAATRIAIPRLETKRLILRGFRMTDFDALCEIHRDPEVVRHIGDGKPRSVALSWAQICMWTGSFGLRGAGLFAIEDRPTGTLLGRSGVLNTHDWPETEIGYTLSRAAWGKGIATEAATAVRDWAWEALNPPALVSFIKVDNPASAAVARRMGATMTNIFTFEDKPTERWQHRRPAGGA